MRWEIDSRQPFHVLDVIIAQRNRVDWQLLKKPLGVTPVRLFFFR